MFLDILKEQYDVEEEDFLSAEIEVVPAGPARDMGLDRSMILAMATTTASALPLHARPDQCGQCRAHEHHAHRR